MIQSDVRYIDAVNKKNNEAVDRYLHSPGFLDSKGVIIFDGEEPTQKI
jgi:hypothetical protein